MKVELKENERIDDLEYKGLKIIQNTDGFCFGIDAVLLSDFAKEIRNNSEVLDLGTGTGILSILLSEKTKLKKIYGIEIQNEVANMAKKSVLLNDLENKIEIINKDIKEIENIFEKNSIDSIVTNPPYKKLDTGKINEKENKFISRHEVTANLEDFVKVSFNLLKDKGSLYMVHRPERLAEIIYILKKNKLEPKKIRFVHSNIEQEPKLVLIKAVKNAKEFLKVEKPLYVYNENGEYTEEILKIYNKI
ncbi:MAG: tRNA1(Val) (adenine(37)-N6)-methyltransferase [Clostridiaceae bacterium]|nr:tRNA1(Val) (adenine(37)-N6)-methyltransferase [Clostridiaceae bacterium]